MIISQFTGISGIFSLTASLLSNEPELSLCWLRQAKRLFRVVNCEVELSSELQSNKSWRNTTQILLMLPNCNCTVVLERVTSRHVSQQSQK